VKDPETGTTVNQKWRVIRLENRFKAKNYPFVEFPARHLAYLSEAVNAALKQYQSEQNEPGMYIEDGQEMF